MKRSAGILMPIFSLPSPYGIGTLGQAARDFLDFLQAGGQSYWQLLPVGPTSYGDSPYQSFSSFAGNPYFIDLDDLAADGLLEPGEYRDIDWGDPHQVDYALLYEKRYPVLRKAVERLLAAPPADYAAFLEENGHWLEDYALFMALKDENGGVSWDNWPEGERLRKPDALAAAKARLAGELDFWRGVQYLFFRQWDALKALAGAKIKMKIIERDEERCRLLSELLPEAMIIHGDGSDQQLLLEEGIRQTEAFASLTGFDEENIMLSLYAASQSKAKLITKVNKIAFENVINSLNLGSVIYPKMLTADIILQYVRAMQNSMGSNIETLYKIVADKAEALEFRVRETSPVVGIALVGIILAWNPDSSVFTIVSFAWAGFGASFGPVMLFALFWRRSNLKGALAGMVSGGIMVFVWKYGVRPLGGAWNIYELLPAFLVACAAIVIVSLATAAPSEEICREFDSVGK